MINISTTRAAYMSELGTGLGINTILHWHSTTRQQGFTDECNVLDAFLHDPLGKLVSEFVSLPVSYSDLF